NLTTKQLALLVGTVSKCHNKLAAQALKGMSFDEEGCESAAVTKFNLFAAQLTNCPGCLSSALGTLGQNTADGLDAALAQTYCASRGGAFVLCPHDPQFGRRTTPGEQLPGVVPLGPNAPRRQIPARWLNRPLRRPDRLEYRRGARGGRAS